MTSRGSVKDDMPRSGDVIVYKKGTTSGRTEGSILNFGALEVLIAGRHYQHVAFDSPSATVCPIIEGSDTDNTPRSGVAMGSGRTPPSAKTGELDAQVRGGWVSPTKARLGIRLPGGPPAWGGGGLNPAA